MLTKVTNESIMLSVGELATNFEAIVKGSVKLNVPLT